MYVYIYIYIGIVFLCQQHDARPSCPHTCIYIYIYIPSQRGPNNPYGFPSDQSRDPARLDLEEVLYSVNVKVISYAY